MFDDMVCVFINPHDFLTYNDKIAGLFSDYRLTANAAIHREDGRKLTDQEIEKLLQVVERMGISIEERSPTSEEERILDDIQVYHPEVKYIIKSYKVEAVRGRKRQRKKEVKKEQERVRQQDKEDWETGVWDEEQGTEQSNTRKKQKLTPSEERALRERQSEDDKRRSKRDKKVDVSEREKEMRRESVEKKRRDRTEKEQYDDPDKFGPKKMEPEERQELYDSLKRGNSENEYSGWKGKLFQLYDFFKNPEMSNEERLALRRGKDKIVRDLRRDYKAMKTIEKQLEENYGLIDYLGVSVDEGMLNRGGLAAFTELIRRDPEIVKSLDLPDIREDMDILERREKMKQSMKKHDDAAIVIDLETLEKNISDIDNKFTDDSENLIEFLKDEFHSKRIKTDQLEIFIDEQQENRGGRVVSIIGPLLEVGKVKVEYDIKNNDMHNKDFWDTRKVG